jgi:competence protein ComEC
MDVIASRGIEHETFNRMRRHHRIRDIELDLLYPPPNFLKLRYSQRWRNINNNSMVVKISLYSVSFLFPGDIMAEAERELISLDDGKLDSTVLIAPHHGSRTSSTPEFVNAVRPEVTVISAGRSGRFRLPHAAVLQRYQDRGCRIFQTALNGAVQINTDGRRLDIKPFISE